MRRTAVLLMTALAVLVAAATPIPAASAAFDANGFEDLAVGAPRESSAAGAVNVLYGSASGLAGANQALTQAGAEAGDRFGSALAKGDFNGDGILDLAVGAPGEGVGGASGAGTVSVWYGAEGGLPQEPGQVLSQGNPERSDLFGEAVAAGRFNGDAFVDLAVGAPGETVGGDPRAGAVTVFSGSATGLTVGGRTILQANPEPGDRFGAELLTVVVSSIDPTPLAVGAPGETVAGARSAGVVNLLEPGAGGLPAVAGSARFQANPEAGDSFGSALAAGHFGYRVAPEPDLAVGAPGETVGGQAGAGSVTVFVALGATGLDVVQGPQAGGSPEAGDRFGAALASGKLWGTNLSDLAVGAPGEDVGTLAGTGAVHVKYGTGGGLFGGGVLTQSSANVPGTAEAGDAFGAALATGSYDNERAEVAQLAVGAPSEDVGTARDAGAVTVLRGLNPDGPPSGGQLFTQGREAGGVLESLDNFGAALA